MKLRYSRTGGIANITTRVEIDSEKLPRGRAKQILDLVQIARHSQSLEKTLAQPLPDDFQHDLEIIEGNRRYRIHQCDSKCSPDVLRLFDLLQQEALSQNRKKK